MKTTQLLLLMGCLSALVVTEGAGFFSTDVGAGSPALRTSGFTGLGSGLTGSFSGYGGCAGGVRIKER